MKTRLIYFEVNNEVEFFDFGSYSLIMYYAKQLNPEKGRKLYDATVSEYAYRVEYQLPLDGLTAEDTTTHFVVPDLEEVVEFLSDNLIPALNNEKEDLIDQFGSEQNFINVFYNNPGYLTLGITDKDLFEGDGSQLAVDLSRLKALFEYSLSQGQPYNVYVH